MNGCLAVLDDLEFLGDWGLGVGARFLDALGHLEYLDDSGCFRSQVSGFWLEVG